MSNHQRRLKTIEVNLTPKQIVILWLKKSQNAGSFADGCLQSPRPRKYVVNAVDAAIRGSLKGYAEPVIEKAICQARQEADWHMAFSITDRKSTRLNSSHLGSL